MGEDESKIKGALEAAKGLMEAVPVYEDAIQGAAKETGKALTTVARGINMVLAPLSVMVWGYDRIAQWLQSRLQEKMKDTPPERMKTPDPSVAGPAIESLRFNSHIEELREMYANLLATCIDAATAEQSHPGFVEIIKQLSPDEARILRTFSAPRAFPVININIVDKTAGGTKIVHRYVSFLGIESGCQHAAQTATYLDNLSRLGLIEIPHLGSYTNKEIYKPLKEHDEVKALCSAIGDSDKHGWQIDEKYIQVTSLGAQFINACVVGYETKKNKA